MSIFNVKVYITSFIMSNFLISVATLLSLFSLSVDWVIMRIGYQNIVAGTLFRLGLFGGSQQHVGPHSVYKTCYVGASNMKIREIPW